MKARQAILTADVYSRVRPIAINCCSPLLSLIALKVYLVCTAA